MKKKIWEKPQLIVLMRTQPQENILKTCKNPSGYEPGPQREDMCSSTLHDCHYDTTS